MRFKDAIRIKQIVTNPKFKEQATSQYQQLSGLLLDLHNRIKQRLQLLVRYFKRPRLFSPRTVGIPIR